MTLSLSLWIGRAFVICLQSRLKIGGGVEMYVSPSQPVKGVGIAERLTPK